MTADRFGPIPAGEYTALSSVRPTPEVGLAAGSEPAPTATKAPTARSAPTRRRDRPWLPSIPPQHGAWAFLIVPVLVGFAVAGGSGPAGWAFLVAWVCAYPVGYYGGRALTARVRRGSWTRLARRELSRALPWAVLTAAIGLPLAWSRPWLLVAAALLAVLWGLGLWVAARRGERSLANDLLLVAQAVAAVPMSVAVVAGPGALVGTALIDTAVDTAGTLGESTAAATAVIGVYLAGSVIHVKSVLREADNAAYRRLNRAWHAAAAVAAAAVSPWWLVGFVPALLRAVLMRPGLRPGAIGGVEAVVSVLMVLAAFLAV